MTDTPDIDDDESPDDLAVARSLRFMAAILHYRLDKGRPVSKEEVMDAIATMKEAADEIERLRKIVPLIREMRDSWRDASGIVAQSSCAAAECILGAIEAEMRND